MTPSDPTADRSATVLEHAPAQEPEPVTEVTPLDSGRRERATPEGDDLDPTRYGDWEKNGRCIDF